MLINDDCFYCKCQLVGRLDPLCVIVALLQNVMFSCALRLG